MNTNRIFLIIVTVLFFLPSCSGRLSQQTTTSDIEIAFDPQSTAVGETVVQVLLTDANGEPINDAEVSVRGDMTHAGMTPVVAEAAGGQSGVYELPFEWTMGGDWFVTVDVLLADGSMVTRRFENISIDGEMEMGDGEMEMTGEEEMPMVMAGTLAISRGMANLALPSETGAVYFSIVNQGPDDDVLLEAAVSGCENSEIHTSEMSDGVMQMRPVEGGRVTLPAGQMVKFEPGGLHVMCIGKLPFEIGEMAAVSLTFENAGLVDLMIPVVDPTAVGAVNHDSMPMEEDG